MVPRRGTRDDFGKALGIAALMVAGSVYGLLVALPWPEREVLPRRPPATAPTLEYGFRLGAAGATAAALGFALDLDHAVAVAAVFGLILPRLTAASPRPPAPRPPGEAGDPAAARARR